MKAFEALDSAGTTTSSVVGLSRGRAVIQIHNAASFEGHLEATLGQDKWSSTSVTLTEDTIRGFDAHGPCNVRLVCTSGTADVKIIEDYSKR